MDYIINSGEIFLTELYDFRERMDLPHRTGDEENFKEYRELYLEKTADSDVPNSPGWSIWYDSKSGIPICVGRSGDLKDRLEGQLYREYHIFWMESLRDSKTVKKMKDLYDPRYSDKIGNEALKHGSDAIFWISLEGKEKITARDLDVVKMKLINKFEDEGKRPRANIIARDCRNIESALFNEVEQIVDKYFPHKQKGD